MLLLSDLQRVLALDALTSSHPLSSDESSIVLPQQISEQFDAISYSKVGPGRPRPPQGARRTDPLGVWLPQGAAVLRMLSDVLSEAVFVQGLSVCPDASLPPAAQPPPQSRWRLSVSRAT